MVLTRSPCLARKEFTRLFAKAFNSGSSCSDDLVRKDWRREMASWERRVRESEGVLLFELVFELFEF